MRTINGIKYFRLADIRRRYQSDDYAIDKAIKTVAIKSTTFGKFDFYTEAQADLIGEEILRNKSHLLLSEVARLAGVKYETVQRHQQIGYIPAPSKIHNGHKHYTADEAFAVIKYFKEAYVPRIKTHGTYTKEEMAKVAGCHLQTIYQYINRGWLSAGDVQDGKRLFYSPGLFGKCVELIAARKALVPDLFARKRKAAPLDKA